MYWCLTVPVFTACQPSCLSCSSDGRFCTNCTQSLVLHKGQCVTGCPRGYFISTQGVCTGKFVYHLTVVYLDPPHSLILESKTKKKHCFTLEKNLNTLILCFQKHFFSEYQRVKVYLWYSNQLRFLNWYMIKNQVNIRGPYTLASKAALFMLHWTSKNLKIKYFFFYIFWNAFQISK